jgi:magnesium transporter
MQEGAAEETIPRSEELVKIVESGAKGGELKELLAQEKAADIARALEHLEEEERRAVLAALDNEQAGDVLTETNDLTMAELMGMLRAERIAGIAEELPPDDAADFVSELPEDERGRVLERMQEEESAEVKALLQYPEETGGGLMTPELVAVREDMTAADAVQLLRKLEEPETIFFIHVVDAQRKLVGSVPLGRLIAADPASRVGGLVDPDVVAIRQDADQEEIARTFREYNLTVAPVVDDEGRLLGRITVDDVVEVLEEEATEDAYKLAGSDDEELSQRSAFVVAKIRLPWLLICLVGSLGAAAIIHWFELALRDFFALTIFIPVITATGGNAGLQSSTITVRGLATGRLERKYLLPAVLREIRVGGIIALTCSVVIGLVARLWSGEMMIAVAIGAAMFCAITAAATLGVVVPISLKKLGKDPAIASGPLITTSNDALGLIIYLGLASFLLKTFR